MQTWFARFGSIAAVSFLASMLAGAAPSDHLIVPGERIGPVSLGMTSSEVYKKLGEPKESYFNGPESSTDEFDGLQVITTGDRVMQITAMSPLMHTQSGVGDGVSEHKVRAEMGKPACIAHDPADPQTYYLVYQGIRFDMHNGTVRDIVVDQYGPGGFSLGGAHC